MAARPEVVKLMTTDLDPRRGPFVHPDGRPFTQDEKDLVMSATGEEHMAAADYFGGRQQERTDI